MGLWHPMTGSVAVTVLRKGHLNLGCWCLGLSRYIDLHVFSAKIVMTAGTAAPFLILSLQVPLRTP